MRLLASTRRRRVTAAAAALAVTAATAVAVSVAGTAGAAGSTVVGVGSGRCLDVVGVARAPRTPVNIYDCNGQVNHVTLGT